MKRVIAGVLLFVMGMCCPASAKEFKLYVDSAELMYGVVQRENPDKDPNAVGDRRLHHKAYGLLQIRSPYLKDVNRIAGTNEVMQTWGKKVLTMEDMKNPAKAKWAFHVYLSWYGNKYRKETGKIPTAYIYARIHNGGPRGWQDRSTLDYALAVVQYIKEYRIAMKV